MISAALAGRFLSADDESCSDLNQVIARAEQSIAEVAGQTVNVRFSLSANVTRVAVPCAELEKIVLGLCIAARSLLGPGGRLVIETRGVNDAPAANTAGLLPADGEARPCVLVRAEQVRPVPPSTTQRGAPAQSEFGLLSIENLLVRLGGRFEFVPFPNNDLAYVAYLPYAAPAQSSGPMPTALASGVAVILLIEDEPQVQAITARILRAYGYGVLTAANERTALAQAELHGSMIALILSDLVLPGISGKELVRRLRQPCERARVLYISGYSQEHAGSLTDGACFLRKPFTAQELLGAVRNLLPESVH